MLELREGSCYPKALVGVNVGLACVDGVIAALAFCQVILTFNSTFFEIERHIANLMINSLGLLGNN